MRLLVSTASRHGATQQIGTRIAETLRARLPGDTGVEVRPAAEVLDVTSYDAVVVGSAVYLGRWLDDARHLVALLAAAPPRPVWLFSSGPVGHPPRPGEEPAEIADLAGAAYVRGHRLFAGRLDRHHLGLAERSVVAALRIADSDCRDGDAIDAWSAEIAEELSRETIG